MTRIVRVEATTVRVPLANPPSFARRFVPAREYTLVRLTDDDGITGVGFLHAGTAGGSVSTAAVRELLAAVVVGQDPTGTELLWKRMYHESLLHGRLGSALRAISAVDMALWDRNAQAAGLPLWQYLGGAAIDSVDTYASGGYYFDGKGPEGLAEEMLGYVDRGFKAVKMKVGRASPTEDEARLAAVRDAVGPGVRIMLDANNAWTDLPDALRAVRRFEAYSPSWIEEPFSPDDLDNHRRLAERTSIPVASGELEGPRWRVESLLTTGGIHILQTDAGVCGGPTEFRRIAALAAAHGVPIYPHAFHHIHLHLVASTPNAPAVEYFPDNTVVNFPDLCSWQPTVTDGRLTLPSQPGLGFDFLADVVARFQTEPWS